MRAFLAQHRLDLAVLAACGALWALAGAGLHSSNDGSHLALARALALRGALTIDPDRDLTLQVDLAVRDGHAYSDRPPGTAALAAGAAALGALLDGPLERATRRHDALYVRPALPHYARTYLLRWRDGPALRALQGTALAIALHTRLVGLCGLALLLALLSRAGVAPWRRRAVVLALGLGSLWGPYSVMLFSHVSAATLLLACWWLAERAGEEAAPRWVDLLGGGAGAAAIASDYLLLLAVVPLVALRVPPGRWWRWLAGAAGPAALLALYHQRAFGSPLATGYRFQQNFAFARDLRATFDGHPGHGLWTLLGAGEGAGLLARSPLWLLGLAGLGDQRWRRAGLALLPWLAALSLYHAPWGGGSADHRYLVPALPLLALGLGLGWQRAALRWPRAARPLAIALAGLALISVARVWLPFLAWRG